ncbi:MAG: transglycosylase domain-containing protein [Alphaproteobacteria bacterium]|nr:transglycosylase domain-containing protein [Alphaproteobacteria bacterium]
MNLLRSLLKAALGYALGFTLLVVLVAASRATLREPAPSLILQDRHGAFLGEVSPGGDDAPLGYWPVETLPERVVAATLALEDRRFDEHPGVDFRAIGRATWQNLQSGEVISGASTLAMQVARMQDPGPRAYGRKAVEAVTALLLTARYGREAVLRQYLRLVPYGNRIRGIRYAAKRYLDKPVEDLSWAETAFLCALPQAPSRTNPFDPEGRRRAVARAQRILTELHAQGLMDDAELDLARKQLETLRVPEQERRPPRPCTPSCASRERLASEPPERARPAGRARGHHHHRPRAPGPARRPGGPPGARSATPGRRPGRPHRRGAGERRGRRRRGFSGLGRAWERRRDGLHPGPPPARQHLEALPLRRRPRPGGLEPPTTCSTTSPADRRASATRTAASWARSCPWQALGNSPSNVPAVLLLQALGVERGYGLLRELGLHEDALPAEFYGLGLAIGGMPVTLEQLVTAYTALAYDGRYRELAWVRGEPVTQRQVLSPEAARTVTRWLADPLARLPSFPRMGFSEYPSPWP